LSFSFAITFLRWYRNSWVERRVAKSTQLLSRACALRTMSRAKSGGKRIGAFASSRYAKAVSSELTGMGARVDELVERDGKVRGVRGDRGEAGRFEVRANVVIGADGRHSLVRRLAGARLEYEHDDFDVVWFLARRPAAIIFRAEHGVLESLATYSGLQRVAMRVPTVIANQGARRSRAHLAAVYRWAKAPF
jgi:hypothetical protein